MRAWVEAGRVNATISAFNGARELGIEDLSGMCDVVMALTFAGFYKSMTTHTDDRIWLDVHYAKTSHGDEAYVELTMIDDVLIDSFKES